MTLLLVNKCDKYQTDYLRYRIPIMKILKIIILLLVVSNAYAQDVTRVVVVEKPAKYVYRVLLESLNKCIVPGLNWHQYSGAYYDDNETASILSSTEAKGFGDSYKLKKIDDNHTEISYFKSRCLLCSMAGAESTLNKTLKWIDDGDRDCQSVEAPSKKSPME